MAWLRVFGLERLGRAVAEGRVQVAGVVGQDPALQGGEEYASGEHRGRGA